MNQAKKFSSGTRITRFRNFLPASHSLQEFEIRRALQAPQKFIPSQFRCGYQGLSIPKAARNLPEYYLNRAEEQLLSEIALGLDIDFHNGLLIDLGEGSPRSIGCMLNEIPKKRR